MQLTLYTDYSLRTLIYLGLHPEGATVAEIAESYRISRNHLVKVVHNLGKLGLIHTTRGKSGGISLAKEPAAIRVGDVVRKVEPNFNWVECFDAETNTCPIEGACRLHTILEEAQEALLNVLNRYTLQDILVGESELLRMLATPAPQSA